jgi:DNA-binding CsgD family transcriptional regulator
MPHAAFPPHPYELRKIVDSRSLQAPDSTILSNEARQDDMPSLPWIKINDFLLQVFAARNLADFNSLVCAHIVDLVPHDFPIFCVTSGRDDLQRLARGERPNKLIDTSIFALAGEPGTVSAWNGYFRFRLPITDGYFAGSLVSDFRPYAGTEFVTDFVRPRSVELCLGGWFRRYTVVVPRCRPARAFSETEVAISRIIAPHLENYYEALSLAVVTREESRKQSMRKNVVRYGLTGREQEIAFLLAERRTMTEIADMLSISRRTVESHAEHIYGKTGVGNKHALAGALFAGCPDEVSPLPGSHLRKDQRNLRASESE